MHKSDDFIINNASIDCIKYVNVIKKKFFVSLTNITEEEFLNCALWDDQKYLLDGTVLSTLNTKFPVKRSYQIIFLKRFIASLENSYHEVHDSIYEELCRLQSVPKDENEHTFKHYILSKQNVIFSMREFKSFVSNGTTGLCTWQASLALSNWILDHPEYIKGKRVLELGSGTGLLGFVASKCCEAKKVLLTDGSPEVIKLLNENMARNFQNSGDTSFFKYGSKEIGGLLLPWEEVESSGIEEIICPDVILAADVVYDNSIFVPLANTLDFIFGKSKNDCYLLLASTVRNKQTLKEFYNVLVQRNFVLDKRKGSNSEDKDLLYADDALVEIVCVYKNKQ